MLLCKKYKTEWSRYPNICFARAVERVFVKEEDLHTYYRNIKKVTQT